MSGVARSPQLHASGG